MMKAMLTCVFLSCFLLHVYATECDSQQAATVQQQWGDTFDANPALVSQFGNACVARMREHNPSEPVPPIAGRAIGRLGRGISLLSDPEELDARIARIRERFPTVNPQPMRTFMENILAVLPEYVGESYDTAAWRSCLTMLCNRVTATD